MEGLEPGHLAQSFGIPEDWAHRLKSAISRSFMSYAVWQAFCFNHSNVDPTDDELYDTLEFICTIAGV